MAFGFAGAAAGAADALQQMLAERRAAFLQQEQLRLQQEAAERQAAQFDASLGMQNKRLAFDQAQAAADEADRKGQRERQATQDRSVENQRGVRRMIGDFLVQRGTQPLDAGSRQTLQGMAIQEDVDLPDAVTVDPEQKFRDYERQKQIDARYRQPASQASPNFLTLVSPDGKQQQRVQDGTQANSLMQQGWKLYDAVAARSAQPANADEAMDTAREVQRLSGSLGNHKGFGGVFGKWSSMVPQVAASQDTVTARGVLKSLQGLLTLENMGKMKGVLSDSDMRILQQASTTLMAEMDEESARQELNRLGRVMSKLTGEQWQDIGGVPVVQDAGTGRASGAGPSGSGFRVIGVR